VIEKFLQAETELNAVLHVSLHRMKMKNIQAENEVDSWVTLELMQGTT